MRCMFSVNKCHITELYVEAISLKKYQVVQVYISWTNTDIAPMRQLVGVKRVSLLSPLNSADVSYDHVRYIAAQMHNSLLL